MSSSNLECIDQHSCLNVFIVGSKPDMVVPVIEADIVYAANSAIRRVQHYWGKSRIVGVISDQIFSATNIETINNVQALVGTKVDHLVLLKSIPAHRLVTDPLQVGIEYTSHVTLSRWDVNRLVLNTISLGDAVWEAISVCSPRELLRICSAFVRGRRLKPVEISTGMIALQLALTAMPTANVYIIGIGIDPESGHDNNPTYRYGIDHYYQDRLYIRSLVKRGLMTRLSFTDPEIQEYMRQSGV